MSFLGDPSDQSHVPSWGGTPVPGGGTLTWGTPMARDGLPPAMDGVPLPAKAGVPPLARDGVGQHKEYLLRGGRYAGGQPCSGDCF